MRPDKLTPRQVLSKNLLALMAARPDLSTIRKIVAASGSRLSNGKVGRITAASHSTDIDTLQALADVFGLEPWQLLVRDLHPNALPRLADASVLNQILDAVSGKTPTAAEGKPPRHESADRLHNENAEPQIGPALKRATEIRGVGKRGSSQPAGVQKSRGGRTP